MRLPRTVRRHAFSSLLVSLLLLSFGPLGLLPACCHLELHGMVQQGDVRGPTDPAELEAFLDGVMEIQLAQHNSAGAVVSVVKDGEVFFAKGYGFADWEAREKVDPERTLFRIGSVTKLFTWTSVMQLVEEGVLDLDTDINEYLSGFQIPDTYPEPITLRHVMTHSAGFEDFVVGLFGEGEEFMKPLGDLLAEQIPARVRPPGEASSYSNHATGMAALIVQEAAGMPWEDFIQNRILDPLGMEQFSVAQPLPEHLAGDMSKGYVRGGGTFREQDFEMVPLFPVGAAAASGEAMARFMIAHLQLGEYGGARILEEETARQMHSELFRMAPGVNAMAHGFYQMDDNGEWIIGHGGDTFWFHSELALFPDRNLGVFVSYNSRGGGAATGEFIDAFVDRYFPEEETIPTPPDGFSTRAHRFTGTYRSNRYSHTSLAKLGALAGTKVSSTDRNTLRAFNSEWVEVAPLTFDEKFGDRTLVFRENDYGEITHLFFAHLPILAYEPVPFLENQILHATLAILAGILAVGTFLAWPLGWAVRRWHGVKLESEGRMPRAARTTLWLAATTFLLFAAGLAITLSDPAIITVEITAGLRFVLLIPLVGALFTSGAAFFAYWSHRTGAGRKTSRVLYTSSTLFFCVFLWQLHVWNLLGWRF
jgi:CubicO group peptidase (beta-lactamase class C family)